MGTGDKPREYRMRCADGVVRTVVEVDGFRVAEAARMAKDGVKKKAAWVEWATGRKNGEAKHED